MLISDLRHPSLFNDSAYWWKWRLTYRGGADFVQEYLRKFSKREDSVDFDDRKTISYSPSFAKAAVNEVRNSIFQRMVDITREGGPQSYQDAIRGLNLGVDLTGRTMNNFIGTRVLPELLTMRCVGIYVDMPSDIGYTIADKQNKHPYLYFYPVEQILTWTTARNGEFTSVLLQDIDYVTDERYNMPVDLKQNLRLLKLNEQGYVEVTFLDENHRQLNQVTLGLTRIPFVLLELSESLLQDVSDYQIALLNLESADINFARRANFPLYVEQYDPRTELAAKLPKLTDEGSEVEIENDPRSIEAGPTAGRRYPLNTQQPAYIHPSPEPLSVSIQKEEMIKRDIRLLVGLAVTNLSPKMASADSKAADAQSLESGLSYIGLELEAAERKIAELWSMYEGASERVKIAYPQNYSLKSDKDRRDEADNLQKLLDKIPSNTYKREIGKQIAYILLNGKVSDEVINTINSEIEKAPTMTSDPAAIIADVTAGLCDPETGSLARGYPEGTVEKAQKARAERIAQTLEAQGGGLGNQARGNPDGQVDQATAAQEKVDKLKRGEQKLQ